MNNPIVHFAPRKIRLTRADNLAPKVVPDALVQCAIADHGKAASLWRYQDQRGVRAIVAMQAAASKLVLCPFQCIDGRLWNDAHDDATARPVLGLRDGPSDRGALRACHGLKLTTGAFSAPGCAWK